MPIQLPDNEQGSLTLHHSFCDLPEISGDALAEEMEDAGLNTDNGPFWKQWRCIFGWYDFTLHGLLALSDHAITG